ncbi:AraC family transcriptional regulator, partial [bacterium]
FPASLLGRELWPVENSPGLRRLLRDGPLEPTRRGVLTIRADVEPFLLNLEKAIRPLARAAALLHLFDALESVGDGLAAPTVPLPVARVLAALEADLSREWDRRRLAEIAGVGEAHLARLFVAAVGIAPMSYLRRLRLTEAAARLQTNSHSVGEIAASVGYLDANLFARRFRQEFGRTPTEGRRIALS